MKADLYRNELQTLSLTFRLLSVFFLTWNRGKPRKPRLTFREGLKNCFIFAKTWSQIGDLYFFRIFELTILKHSETSKKLWWPKKTWNHLKCMPGVEFEYLDIWIEYSYFLRRHSSSPLAAFAPGTKKGAEDHTRWLSPTRPTPSV